MPTTAVRVIAEEGLELNGERFELGDELVMPSEAVQDCINRKLVEKLTKAEAKELHEAAAEEGGVMEAPKPKRGRGK